MTRFEEPEIPDIKPVRYCDKCGDDIFAGDSYYKTDDGNLCPECAKEFEDDGYIRLIADEDYEEN